MKNRPILRTILTPQSAVGLALLLGSVLVWSASRPPDLPFEKIQIDGGASESCTVADVNGDKRPDVIAGEFWYEFPSRQPHRFRELSYMNGYIDNFVDIAMDVDNDGRLDVVSGSYFGQGLRWWRNPGKDAMWNAQTFEPSTAVEFAFLVDLDGDGKAQEILPQFGGRKAFVAWYEVRNGAFVKHQVSDTGYGHGVGAGDVNNDGRPDIITPKGWFAAPANIRSDAWTWHPEFDLGSPGFIHVLDVNKDGRNDLVSSAAHDYGVYWMEQGADKTWTKHVIDDTWSQAHAMTMVDLNGDKQMDFLTGKRYMAHDHDPGSKEPLGIYWYEFMPGQMGKVMWVKHVVDYSTRTGAGMHLPVADLNGDGTLDFVAPGKSGLFWFMGQSKAKATTLTSVR